MIFGKIICAMLGLMVGAKLGPVMAVFAAVLGAYLGDSFDKGLKALSSGAFLFGISKKSQQTFFHSTFSIMGFIAKLDGRVSEDEIKVATQIMERLSLDTAAKKNAIQFFSEGKGCGFVWQDSLRQLKKDCGNKRDVLQLFMEIQIETAYADSISALAKKKLLVEMSQQLGFSVQDYDKLEKLYHARQRFRQQSRYRGYYQQHNQQQQRNNITQARRSLNSAYAILGCKETDSLTEIKRAYRKLMSKNHPDKLIAQGVPEEMLKLATEKTQEIKAAYDQVVKSRQ